MPLLPYLENICRGHFKDAAATVTTEENIFGERRTMTSSEGKTTISWIN